MTHLYLPIPPSLLSGTAAFEPEAPPSRTFGMLDQPPGLHADPTGTWILFGLLLAGAVVALAASTPYAVRQRDPMLLWLMPLGIVCTLGETIGDWAYAISYPADTPGIAFTLLEHHIPWWIFLVWVGLPFAAYAMYRMIIGGASVSRVLAVAMAIGLWEVALEMLGSHYGAINYFGYNAKILGLPLTTIVQNCFMLPLLGVVVATTAQRLQGWRKAYISLFIVPTAIGLYFVGCTWPALITAHLEMSTRTTWAVGAFSALLNLGVGVAVLYGTTARGFRAAAAGQTQAEGAARRADMSGVKS